MSLRDRERRSARGLHAPAPASRRSFLALGGGMLAGGLALGRRLLAGGASWSETSRPPLRPPTADASDATFRAKCVRCGLCGLVCENGCIRFFGLTEPEHGALTPFIDPRRRSCTLCMRCTQICPSGALQAVEADLSRIPDEVDMGIAVVDPDRCFSYLGRVCGYCHDACPLPGTAIRLVSPATPVVLADACVGCGRCEELCPQNPTAIYVVKGEGPESSTA